MKICDRTLALTGKHEKAEHEIVIDQQVVHLSTEALELVKEFVFYPKRYQRVEPMSERVGKTARKVLGLREQ